MSESDIQSAILEYLRWTSGFAEKVAPGPLQNAYGQVCQHIPAGTSDIVSCAPDGGILFVEAKAPGYGRLSDAQVRFLRSVHGRGLRWVVAESVGDVERHLSDPSYHGPDRHVSAVVDRSSRFVFGRAGKKVSASMVHEKDRFDGYAKTS